MKIIIAEDDKISNIVIANLLKKWGYEVVNFYDGREAWKYIQSAQPPFILLSDWMMPGFSGIDLIKKIKTREYENLIYRILLTAKNTVQDKIEGLEYGAQAFIKKPFDPSELKSQIKIGEKILNFESAQIEQNKKIQLYAEKMEKLAEERAKQLVHSDRIATIGLLSAGVAHEINNPTTFISGNVQIIKQYWPIIEKYLTSQIPNSAENRPKLEMIIEEMPEILNDIIDGVKRISKITASLRRYACNDTTRKSKANINNSLDRSLELVNNKLKYNINIVKNYTLEINKTMINENEIEQVFINIFINAADAMGKSGGDIVITTRNNEEYIEILIEDSGPGFKNNDVKKIFIPFFTTKEPGKGTGLGMSISQKIISEHNGKIMAENCEKGGARFRILLPIRN